MTFFILIVSVIALLFLFINLLFAPHKPNQEKASAFECGFHSFFQSRLPFVVTFFLYGITFLCLDLDLFLIFPYTVSSFKNEAYGLFGVFIFLIIVTVGFVFELGKGALNIDSKQNYYNKKRNFTSISSLYGSLKEQDKK